MPENPRLLLLPGSNPDNGIWADCLSKELRPHFPMVSVWKYKHWTSGDQQIHFDAEFEAVSRLSSETYHNVILAKSVGTILALKAIYTGEIRPQACMFLGMPIYSARAARLRGIDVDLWLKDYTVPTVFIQQAGDPVMTANELNSLLISLKLPEYRLVTWPGSDHKYSDARLLARLASQHLLPYIGRNPSRLHLPAPLY